MYGQIFFGKKKIKKHLITIIIIVTFTLGKMI